MGDKLNQLNNQIQPYPWVLKQIVRFDFQKVGDLKDKVIVISGASRGIGLAIALKAAKDGAKIAILAKSDKPHPQLPGTIFTAAEEIKKAGGEALPLKCDIRFQNEVQDAVDSVVSKWGKIDICINNASALSLTNTESTSSKVFDLMHQINTRGTFLLSKLCIPYMLDSPNPHILNLCPPLNFKQEFFSPHVAYTMAKMGMSMCVQGMSEEFQEDKIGVNGLWPRTAIATSAVKNVIGKQFIKTCRTPEIMADAAYFILTSDSQTTNGNFFIDDEVLANHDIVDLTKYQVDPNLNFKCLTPDFFV